jgi:ElaB/YqjD/DUF883 family membrane-anchored ribosome-binding protein
MTNYNKPESYTPKEIKENLRDNLREETQEIKKDIQSLKGNIVGLASKAIETGSDSMVEAKRMAGEELEKLRTAGTDNLRKVEERVRAKPGQSIAVAFIAGFLLNTLFGRK